MAIKSFDRYFLNFPELSCEKDFEKFWEKSISDIKKIPIEPEINESHKRSSGKFKCYEVSYNGYLKVRIRGLLFVPKNRKKIRVVIHLHDYNRYPDQNPAKYLTDDTAHLFLVLRGHAIIEHRAEEEPRPLGFIVENIIDLETYYVRSVYLDIFRSVDFLRLIKFLDCDRIGIYGKGLGAAAGFFTAVYSNRICGIVLDAPSFCNLPLSQNISMSDNAIEINDIIAIQKGKKNQIKKNLSYFDIINFSPNLECPALFITGLKDEFSPTECVMGLFNHIQSEKTIEVFPDEGNDAGGETQKIKSIRWLSDLVNRP